MSWFACEFVQLERQHMPRSIRWSQWSHIAYKSRMERKLLYKIWQGKQSVKLLLINWCTRRGDAKREDGSSKSIVATPNQGQPRNKCNTWGIPRNRAKYQGIFAFNAHREQISALFSGQQINSERILHGHWDRKSESGLLPGGWLRPLFPMFW